MRTYTYNAQDLRNSEIFDDSAIPPVPDTTTYANNFEFTASIIVQLYQQRWHIELYFKWIKQHLKIQVFYGTSENAVKTQIWIAICTYVLVAIVKKRLQIEHSLYNMLQILSVNPFEKMPLQQLFTPDSYINEDAYECNQLNLFEL